eukprot:scaffold151028_cov48-Tisochrysis_lutea.AAC.1
MVFPCVQREHPPRDGEAREEREAERPGAKRKKVELRRSNKQRRTLLSRVASRTVGYRRSSFTTSKRSSS